MNKLNRITIMMDNKLLSDLKKKQIEDNCYSLSETIRRTIMKTLYK